MPITTYSELVDEVAAWSGRRDAAFTGRVPQFLRAAELRMNRDLRIRSMEREATATTTAGVAEVPLPAVREAADFDVFVDMRELFIQGEPKPLSYAAPTVYRERAQSRGLPKVYTIKGRSLFLGPVPDGVYTLEMSYYSEIPPLSADNPSNLILIDAPDLYLFGTLFQSTFYTRNAAARAEWGGLYDLMADSLKTSEQKARFTSNLASRPIRRV